MGVGKSLIFLPHLVGFHMYLCNRIEGAGVCLQRSQNSSKGPRASFSRRHRNAGAGIAVCSSLTWFRCWGEALHWGQVAGGGRRRWVPKREPCTLRCLSCLKQTGRDGHHRYLWAVRMLLPPWKCREKLLGRLPRGASTLKCLPTHCHSASSTMTVTFARITQRLSQSLTP